MGWTFKETRRTALQVCRDDFGKEWKGEKGTTRQLADAMVGSTYYAAMQTTPPGGGAPQVWALVVLTETRSAGGRREVGTKPMDETCGPNESLAPASILSLLTPTESEWAKAWRARCMANLKRPVGQCALDL